MEFYILGIITALALAGLMTWLAYLLATHHLVVTPFYMWYFWIEPGVLGEDDPESIYRKEVEERFMRRRIYAESERS